jgi:hypothetical protein
MTDTNHDDDDRAAEPSASSDPSEFLRTPTAGLTASELPELVGWQPDFPPVPARTDSQKVTVWMTDEQILAHYRDRNRNPDLNMGTATALHNLDMKFGYLAAAVENAREQERQEAERRLRDLVNGRNEGAR